MLEWLKKNSKWASYFILGAALIAVYKTFDSLGSLWSGVLYIFSAFKPFIFAFVVAYMLNIPVKKLNSFLDKETKGKNINKYTNTISIAAVYIIFIAVIVLVMSAIIPAIAKDMAEFTQNISLYSQNIAGLINGLGISERFGIELEAIDLSKQISGALEKFMSIDYSSGIKTITTGIASFASGLMNIFIGLIASVYMLIDKERIISGVKRLANILYPGRDADLFINHWSRVNTVFTQYIYSRLTCCVVMAILCSFILVLTGEKYALLLGIFIGIMDLIPYFGSIISWVVGFLVMAISGGWAHSFWASAIILVVQQFDGNILAPRVMGERLEIRPLTIIIAVSVGGTLFGFAGMVLSVPIVAILRTILSEMIDEKAENKNKEAVK